MFEVYTKNIILQLEYKYLLKFNLINWIYLNIIINTEIYNKFFPQPTGGKRLIVSISSSRVSSLFK